jgi:hypothetical protein
MNLTLQRTAQSDACTEGMILLPSTVLYSLELPWVPQDGYPGGWPDRSCVPAGFYELALHDTPKHPKTFALVNRSLGVIHEPDSTFPNARVACLIHVANTVGDLEGCIGVGISHGPCYVSSSGIAFSYLRQALPWVEGHTLTINDPPT